MRLPCPAARLGSSLDPGSPAMLAELGRRGVAVEPQRGEGRDAYENRISTALMALYRDTRDPAVFEALYTFARTSVELWITSLLGRELGQMDPAEVLQDTFVNVYRYPGAFREEHGGSFRVWVRTIAGNVVRRCSLARLRNLQQEPVEAPELEDRSSGPVQTILEEDESLQLRRAWILLLCYYAEAWKELSQRDRRTLHLVEVEGLSYQEAGRVLDVRRSNMKMIVFRSRRRLARRMRAAMASAAQRGASELVA